MTTGDKNAKPAKTHPSAPMLEMVRVRTQKFQCLAYRDTEGQWWDKNHQRLTEEVLSWEPL